MCRNYIWMLEVGDKLILLHFFPLYLSLLKLCHSFQRLQNHPLDPCIAGGFFVMLLLRTGLSAQLKQEEWKKNTKAFLLEIKPGVDWQAITKSLQIRYQRESYINYFVSSHPNLNPVRFSEDTETAIKLGGSLIIGEMRNSTPDCQQNLFGFLLTAAKICWATSRDGYRTKTKK